MGLREMNATRTRELLAETAMALFVERGYDATTMEDVAHEAAVGISTVYRYFPAKEQLATAFLGDPGLMADALTARPDEEDPELSLGHALTAFLEHTRRTNRHADRFQDVVATNARVRGRVMEWLAESQERLCEALAARHGVGPDDLAVGATAWLAIYVLLKTDEEPGEGRTASEVGRDVMRRLAAGPLRTPLAPDA